MRIWRVSAIIAVVAVLGSLLVVWQAGVRRNQVITSCASNLAMLWSLQRNYAIQFGGPSRAMPDAPGSEFWRALEKTNPPLFDAMEREIFLCPFKGDGAIGEIDYFGPGLPVHRLVNADPVGCDDPRNHGSYGGNVLLKSGDIQEFTSFDLDALLKTHPTPPRR
jgi:hypothetical protein